MSPAWTMCALPASARSASSRIRPWVSEMSPTRVPVAVLNPAPMNPNSVELSRHRGLNRDLHQVLAEEEIALVDFRHLPDQPLLYARHVHLLSDVARDEV